MKKHIKTILIIVLIGTNILTLYGYNKEKLRIKNAFVPSFQDDYLTRQLNLTELYKNYEEEGSIFYRNFAVEKRADETKKEEHTFDYDVPLIEQNPDFPNGCEAASATMLLNYYDIDINLETFVSDYLIKKPVYDKDGKRYGPDPSESFAGDPRDALYGWGTLEPTVKQSIIKVMEEKFNTPYYSILGNDNKMSLNLFAEIYSRPFIIWTTTDYTPVREVYQWYSYDGSKTYTYSKNSHTVLVDGMDEEYYYINDSLKDESHIKVKKETLETSFDSAGWQAIAIDISHFQEEA